MSFGLGYRIRRGPGPRKSSPVFPLTCKTEADRKAFRRARRRGTTNRPLWCRAVCAILLALNTLESHKTSKLSTSSGRRHPLAFLRFVLDEKYELQFRTLGKLRPSLFFPAFYLSVYLSIFLSIYLSIYLSFFLSLY